MPTNRQIVSLSGGKDSTAMLLMMLERGEPIDGIVFFDWGMEFPQMYEHLEKLESYIKMPITRVYPQGSFVYYLTEYERVKGKTKGQRGYGWAGFKLRWCTKIKYNAINKATKDSTHCIGYSYNERFTRPRYFNHHRYPLLEWGVTELEGLRYCYSKGFEWGGLYSMFNRLSCWCCPFKRLSELRKLRDNFPDLWQQLLELDRLSPYSWPNNNLNRCRQEVMELNV